MTSKEKAHALQVLLKGENNETYGGIIIFNNNMTYKLVPEHKSQYDHTGAAYYVVAVVLVYGLSIILLIASHIKRKHKKFVEDRQINRYLQAAPSLKEKSAKARWKELKMSFIPITLATVAIGNSIAASEKHHLTTVSEETDDEVQELEAITIDTGYGNRHDEIDDGDDESICLLNDTCDTTDDEILAEFVTCLSDTEGHTDSGIGNISDEKQVDTSLQSKNCISPSAEEVNLRSPTKQVNGYTNDTNDQLDNNENTDMFVAYSSPVHTTYSCTHQLDNNAYKKVPSPSTTHHLVTDTASHDSPGASDRNKQTDMEGLESENTSVETWVKRQPPVGFHVEQTPETDRETQL